MICTHACELAGVLAGHALRYTICSPYVYGGEGLQYIHTEDWAG